PTRSRASTTVTRAPRASSARAADSPARPAPATTTLVPAKSREAIVGGYTWSDALVPAHARAGADTRAGAEGARPVAHRRERRGSRRRDANARRQGRDRDRSR